MSRFQKYIDYINNTGMRPIKPEVFDEDWELVGPMVRRDMMAEGLIYESGKDGPFACPNGIYLRPDLVRRK